MANVTYILQLKDKITQNAKRAKASLDKLTRSAENTANAIDGVGILAGTVAIAGIFKMGAELEKTTLFFNTLTGSVERGTKLFEELTEFANTTPFSNQALNRNAQTLLAFGQEADTVTKTLRMLGDVSGGDADRLQRLTLAFAQTQSAGRLMGQDLLQFINAGFNPLNEISKATGISMGALKKRMEQGAISAELVKKAFERATGEGGKFHGLTQSMATTMAGMWSTALGKGMFLISEFGLSMKGIFAPFLRGIIKAIDFISKFRAVFFPVIKFLTVFTGVVIGLVGALKLWVAVQKILNVLLTLNPIGLIITAIGLLIAGIIVLYNESETFRLVVAKTWAALRTLWSLMTKALAPAFNELTTIFKEVINGISNLFSSVDDGAESTANWAEIIKKVLGGALTLFLVQIRVLVKTLKRVFNIFKKVGSIVKSVFNGDFGAAKTKLKDFVRSLKDGLLRTLKGVFEGIKLLGRAFVDLLGGSFEKAAENAAKGGNAIAKALFDVDVSQTKKEAEKIANDVVDTFNRTTAKKAIVTPGLSSSVGPAGALDLSEEAKKLQAEGIVSGGRINTFNITISNLTGVENVNTNNIKEGAVEVGNAVKNELLGLLADLKPI